MNGDHEKNLFNLIPSDTHFFRSSLCDKWKRKRHKSIFPPLVGLNADFTACEQAQDSMTHRGPFQPLPFCDSVILCLSGPTVWAVLRCHCCFSDLTGNGFSMKKANSTPLRAQTEKEFVAS